MITCDGENFIFRDTNRTLDGEISSKVQQISETSPNYLCDNFEPRYWDSRTTSSCGKWMGIFTLVKY